jgi:hypothetical protein
VILHMKCPVIAVAFPDDDGLWHKELALVDHRLDAYLEWYLDRLGRVGS